MKDCKLNGSIPAGLDPAGIESMLRGMNEAAAEGCEYCNDEAPLIRAGDTEVYIRYTPVLKAHQLVMGRVSRGGRTVGRRIERCPVCGRALEGD